MKMNSKNGNVLVSSLDKSTQDEMMKDALLSCFRLISLRPSVFHIQVGGDHDFPQNIVIELRSTVKTIPQFYLVFSQELETKIFMSQLKGLKNRIFAMENADKEIIQKERAIRDAKQKLISALSTKELELLGINLNQI